MNIDETTILASDLEDIRIVLDACLGLNVADDIREAQRNFTSRRSSPLTLEIERVKKRVDGIFGDYLLRRHEEASALDSGEDDLDVEEDLEDAEDGSEELTEASEEEVTGAAFAEPVVKRQKGRRLSAQEAAGDATEPG